MITGASSGIGAGFARAMPPETDLLLAGRDMNALSKLAVELATPERQVDIVQADLTTDPGRDKVIDAAERAGIDLLVNNAGLGVYGKTHANPPAQERAMVELNITTPVVLTRALLPGMIARAKETNTRAGVIIVASIAAFLPTPRLATYSASKAFDLHYAEALADDLHDEPVDVLALCPGFTNTSFGERSGMKEWMFARAATPEQVAIAALVGLGRRRVVLIGSGSILSPLTARFVPRRYRAQAVILSMKGLKFISGR